MREIKPSVLLSGLYILLLSFHYSRSIFTFSTQDVISLRYTCSFFFFFYKKTKKINVYPRGCLVDQARDSRLVTSSQARPGQFVCFFFFLHISRCLFCVILHFISENVHTVPALPLHLWHGLGCPIHYACFNIINKMHVPFFINLAHNVA